MKFFKKCIVTFLVVCILVSACGCYNLSDTIIFPDSPHMSERVYEKLDEEAANALFAEIADLCQSAENLDLVIEKRDQFFTDYYNKVSTLYTIASINFDKNIYDEYWQNESVWIANFYQQINKATLELEKVIFSSPCADYFIQLFGQDYADFILNANAPTDEQLELLARIAELEAQYMPLYYSPDRSIEAMADLLRDLVINRNAYARTLKNAEGEYYDNYLDYAYESVYGRDYTPEDAVIYREALKNNLYSIASDAYVYYMTYYPIYKGTAKISEDQIKQFLPEIINQTVPEMMPSWDYMMDKGLYDFTYSTNKARSSYVVTFSKYGDAFLFLNANTNFISDLSTVIHEFGHYNERFMSSDFLVDENAGRSYDLAETHSQALELLTLPAVESICDKYYSSMPELYQGYSSSFIFNSLWGMLSGCIVDAFEYKIYNADEEDLTTDFFRQSFLEYAAYYFPINSGREFPDVSHIFTAPGYYISYSVSMVFSYVIWASDNPIENYVEVVKYGSSNYLSNVCKATKLDYPFDPDTIVPVSEAIIEYLNSTFAE